MPSPKSEEEVREFYQRWGAQVLTFCRLLLGDDRLAENATADAFVLYLRKGLALESRQLPNLLLGCAVNAAKERCSPGNGPIQETADLKSAILSLPCEERAVFILRAVLGLDFFSVAIATGLASNKMQRLWIGSLLPIRGLLSKESLKECIR